LIDRLEARLGETIPTGETTGGPAVTIAEPADRSATPAKLDGPVAERREALASIEATSPVDDAGEPNWPDDAAETAFLSEARERGESVAPSRAKNEVAVDTDAIPLPSLDELVQRIPADVREALDDLFRAKFTTVQRIPRKALKD
jgi:hypothetical protein